MAALLWENSGMSRTVPPAPEAIVAAATAPAAPVSEHQAIIDATRLWLERAVIGLNLCPFANAVHRKNRIRYVVSRAQDRDALAADLAAELLLLQATDPDETDTTLLIHPAVLTDFYDYNAFLEVADRILERLDLAGEIQVASFHPDYAFGDCAADAIENYTNRSPYPMLHLLRESSVEQAIAAYPDTERIYEKNIETLRQLGIDGWLALGLGPTHATPDR